MPADRPEEPFDVVATELPPDAPVALLLADPAGIPATTGPDAGKPAAVVAGPRAAEPELSGPAAIAPDVAG